MNSNKIAHNTIACRPDTMFLETISYFPLVYWMLGSITRYMCCTRSCHTIHVLHEIMSQGTRAARDHVTRYTCCMRLCHTVYVLHEIMSQCECCNVLCFCGCRNVLYVYLQCGCCNVLYVYLQCGWPTEGGHQQGITPGGGEQGARRHRVWGHPRWLWDHRGCTDHFQVSMLWCCQFLSRLTSGQLLGWKCFNQL